MGHQEMLRVVPKMRKLFIHILGLTMWHTSSEATYLEALLFLTDGQQKVLPS